MTLNLTKEQLAIVHAALCETSDNAIVDSMGGTMFNAITKKDVAAFKELVRKTLSSSYTK